ncbi:MAG: glycosyltransferase family 39 protein [Chloroflexia bacterium]|nr:glycosyltransferase family 39 protein [Chloroflexia bacterium]
MLVALYLLAAAALLLPWPFGAHPAWAYNWEGYTAWRWATYWEPPTGPTFDIWAPTDGLMTDSGQGPLVGLPVAIGIALGGVRLEAMRIPVTLVAAAAIPVFWLLGRRLIGSGVATLAALLLATSPVFLLYARTATLVGISLLPLLLSVLALVRVLDAGPGEGWRWGREGLLAASLLLGIYAYAPVRLVWPIAVAMLCLAAARDPIRRKILLRTAVLCALIVPAATMTLERLAAPEPDPLGAAAGYFHARGEQLLAMSGDPTAAAQYVRAGDVDVATGWETAVQLVGQNAVDLMKLLLDRGTGPAPAEYWNEHGRFWPWFFFPFALVGGFLAVRGGWTSGGQIVMVLPAVIFLGLTLPLFLTSRVHVGRLLPALPFALLLVASGVWAAAGWLATQARRAGAGEAARWIAPFLAGALLVPAVVSARVDLETPLSPSRESLTAAVLADWGDDASERGGAVLVEDPALGDDIERVHAATYRFALDGRYRFVDLRQQRPETGDDPRPALLWRNTLGALQAGEIARPCARLWFVAPEIAGEFFASWQGAGCVGAPDSVILP